jgi:HK97 gp10 family phage protein
MQVSIRIRGAREVLEAMQQLPRKLDRRLLNRGLLAGARLTRDEAKRLAPVLQGIDRRRRPGMLRNAIRAAAVRPAHHAATVWVRVRGLTRRQIASFRRKSGRAGALNPNDPFYWRFVEFGTSRMAAKPFLRPAFETTKHAAVAEIIRASRDLVQAEIAKLGRFAGARNQLTRITGIEI